MTSIRFSGAYLLNRQQSHQFLMDITNDIYAAAEDKEAAQRQSLSDITHLPVDTFSKTAILNVGNEKHERVYLILTDDDSDRSYGIRFLPDDIRDAKRAAFEAEMIQKAKDDGHAY